jgi:hypothetical protein
MHMFRKWIPAAIAAPLAALALGIATPTAALAHFVPAPCDFITAGGFVQKDDGGMANFGAHGGCKNDGFWGNVNYVDHNQNLHMSSTQITGYLFDPADPNRRDICGWARTNDGITVQFRVTLVDNGEPGVNDEFGITMDTFNQIPGVTRFYTVTSRQLADGGPGGGNVQLHKSNPSTTASPQMQSLKEWQMCGDLNSPR